MSTKFEQLLDYLVNEEMDKANELFHEIVVEKSREIYENLIAEEEQEAEEAKADADESVEEAEEEAEESVDEAEEAEESVEEAEEEAEESMDLEDSYDMDEGDDDAVEPSGMEKTGDFGDEVSDAGDEMPAGGDEEQAFFDIKDALNKLEAAFDELAQAQGADVGDKEMPGDDAMPGDDKPEEMMGFSEGRRITREYTENVGMNWEKGNTMKAQGQYVGAGSGDKDGGPVEGKSPIANLKKPSIGDTSAKNILGDKKVGAGTNVGTSPAKPDMGVVKAGGKFVGNNTHNVDGVKSGVKTLSKVAGGHGAEKKGAGPGPVGSGSGDKAGQTAVAPETKKPFLKPVA